MIVIILSQLLLLSGAITATYLAFSFSFAGWGPLAWIAPVLLALLATDASPRKSALIFGSYALICWATISWWLTVGVNAMNPSYPIAGYLTLVALALLSSVPYGVFGYLAGRLRLLQSRSPRPCVASALLTLLVELWPARLPGTLGHCLYRSTSLIQIVDLGGTGLLSFLIYAAGFAFASALQLHQSSLARIRFLTLSLAPILATLIYSSIRYNQWSDFISSARRMTISMIQPNLPIKEMGSPNSSENSLLTLIQQTENLLHDESGQDLIVWPEIPIYFSPHNIPANREALNELLRDKKTPLLLNADLYTNETVFDRVPYYNTVQLFQGSGEVKQEYRKMILVPFGEYLPFESWMTGPKWERVLAEFRRYVPGDKLNLITISPSVVAGTPICLEGLHTQHIGAMINAGANLLINPANDAYFGSTRGAEVDFALTVFRAVEYRVPLIRVTNSGVSAAIDQRGEIIAGSLMPAFEATTRTVSVAPSSQLWVILPRTWGLLVMLTILIYSIIYNRYCKHK